MILILFLGALVILFLFAVLGTRLAWAQNENRDIETTEVGSITMLSLALAFIGLSGLSPISQIPGIVFRFFVPF